MPLFRRKKKSRKEIDYNKDPYSLKANEVKYINKPYSDKTHFIGWVNLCTKDVNVSNLLLKSLNKHFDSMRAEISASGSHNTRGSSRHEATTDMQMLIGDPNDGSDDNGSDDENYWEASNESLDRNESGSEIRSEVKHFNFSEVVLRLGVPSKASDTYRTNVDVLKKILFEDTLIEELNGEGDYLFKALLPTKSNDWPMKLHHWLLGFIVVIDHEPEGQQQQDSQHFPCDQLSEKLRSLEAVLKYSVTANNIIRNEADEEEEEEQTAVVFMNSSGTMPENCPANRNLESIDSPCQTCVTLSKEYECSWANNFTAGFTTLCGQDVMRFYRDLLTRVLVPLVFP